MTTQHTPGPWVVGQSYTDEPAIREPGGQCVGVACNSPFEEEEYLANARLIAAAPELLKACMDFIGADALTWDNDEECDTRADAIQDAKDAMQAAIKKAISE